MPARGMHKVKLSNLGEFGLIDLLKKQIGGRVPNVRGIGDDTAVLPLSSKKQLLLTTDMLLEGVHFTREMPARGIGYKAMGSNISDIAAMGGIPKYAVISLGIPSSVSWQFVSNVYEGMQKIAKDFGIDIVGGDTVQSTRIIINIALVGEAGKSAVVYRSGARVGNQIFVTGPLGRSLASGWHLWFTPRVVEAQYLVKKYKPTAMIDISDGLVADLGHILSESKVGAVIEERLIPKRQAALLAEALYDGEDFELLFTVSSSKARELERQKKGGYRFYRIGEIVSQDKGMRLKTNNGRMKKLVIKGYTHF